MADNSIQTLQYSMKTPNGGMASYQTEVNKSTGASVTYDISAPFQKDAVLQSNPVVVNGKQTFKTEFAGKGLTSSAADKEFLTKFVAPQADNQRAAYIKKNFTPSQQNTQFAGVPKVQNNATPGAGNTTTQSELQISIKDKVGGVRMKYDGAGGENPLRYPLERKKEQDYIKFSMYQYSPKKFNPGGGFGDRIGSNKDNSRSIIGCATLPIQPNISDSNQVAWGEDPINAFDALAQGTLLGLMEGKSVNVVVEELKNTIETAAPALKAYLASAFASAATATNKNMLTRVTGAILNPNAELLFSGPSLRGFSFTFTLSAREPAEAIQIKKIIRFFKQGMSVKRSESFLFLKSPNTFGISYIYGEKETDHPWINKIKECALTNFGVTYTPAGNYATYEDGSMTSYDLSMQFQELDPIYDDDYNEADGNEDTMIGY